MKFEEQIKDLELVTYSKPSEFLRWVNTEDGRDKNDSYERLVFGNTVIYINTNNRSSSITIEDPFWDVLEKMYERVKK